MEANDDCTSNECQCEFLKQNREYATPFRCQTRLYEAPMLLQVPGANCLFSAVAGSKSAPPLSKAPTSTDPLTTTAVSTSESAISICQKCYLTQTGTVTRPRRRCQAPRLNLRLLVRLSLLPSAPSSWRSSSPWDCFRAQYSGESFECGLGSRRYCCPCMAMTRLLLTPDRATQDKSQRLRQPGHVIDRAR